MFLCVDCHPKEVCFSIGSYGPCEGCKKTSECLDCHDYNHKVVRKEEPTITIVNPAPVIKKSPLDVIMVALTRADIQHIQNLCRVDRAYFPTDHPQWNEGQTQNDLIENALTDALNEES